MRRHVLGHRVRGFVVLVALWAPILAPGAAAEASRASAPIGGGAIGVIDQIVRVPGGLRVVGWALDYDVVDPIDVHVYADETGVATTASLPRPDVAAAYPGYGPNHGFTVTVPTLAGLRNVCAAAISVGDGGYNPGLGCYLVQVSSTPFGFVDRIHQVPGAVQVDGWAIDPDTAAAIEVHAYAGSSGAPTNANLARPDVANVLPDYGGAHGFSVAAPVAAGGVRDVCAYGMDTTPTSPAGVLGCQPLDVQVSPWGAVDVVNMTGTAGAGFRVRGWAIDPSTGESLDVRIVWRDWRAWMPWHDAGIARADTPRPDLLAHFPEWGPGHGFDVTISDALWYVSVDVCVYAFNKGPGEHVLLGCSRVEHAVPSM